MKQTYKALIFDWDGTLADSTIQIVDAIQFAFNQLKLPTPNIEAAKSIIGLGLDLAMEKLYPQTTPEINSQLVYYYRQYYFRETNVVRFFDDVKTLLPKLNQDFILTIATGKSREGLNRALEQTESAHLFYSSRTVDECASKPAPEMIYSLCDELGMQADDVIMIGDTTHDLQMAYNAGVDAIGLTTGAHNIQTLNQIPNQGIYHSFTEFVTDLYR